MSDNQNPFDEIEQQLRRERNEKQGKEVMEAARTRLIMGKVGGPHGNPVSQAASVFFSTLLLKLKVQQSWECKTTNVDGETLIYNPEYVCKLADLEQTCGVLAHDVMHCALLHQARREHREEQTWQIACDFVVNEQLRQANFKLPVTALFAGEGEHHDLPKGKTEEEYYDLLKKKKGDKRDGESGVPAGGSCGAPDQGDEQDDDGHGKPGGKGAGKGQGQGKGKGQPDPGGCGTVTEPQGNGAGKAKNAADWKGKVAEAGQAAEREAQRSKGDCPAWMKRLVHGATHPKVDWRDVLREFMTRWTTNDYDWSRPNSRIMAAVGVYMPRLRSPDLGQVVVFVDTSGSIGQKTLDLFAGELQGILDDFSGVELRIVYHDAKVYEDNIQEWTPDMGPLKMEPVGGGGTSHVPCFDWLNGPAQEQGIDASCVVCLTDAYTVIPESPPDCPVLWAVVGNKNPNIPWGQVVLVE